MDSKTLFPILEVDKAPFKSSFKVLYGLLVRSRVKVSSIAPTFLEIDMLLSLKIMTILRCSLPI